MIKIMQVQINIQHICLYKTNNNTTLLKQIIYIY